MGTHIFEVSRSLQSEEPNVGNAVSANKENEDENPVSDLTLIRGGETHGYSTYLLEVSSYREMLRFVSKMKRS